MGKAATWAAVALDEGDPLLVVPQAIEDSNIKPANEALKSSYDKVVELAGLLKRAVTLANDIKGNVASAETHTVDAKTGSLKYKEDLADTATRFEAAMRSQGT